VKILTPPRFGDPDSQKQVIHFSCELAVSLVRMRKNSINSASGLKSAVTIVFSYSDFL